MPNVEPLRAGDPAAAGPYRLVGRLGSGGRGAGYLGRGRDGRPVAVKLLPEVLADRERLVRELTVARRMEPSCLARVLDAATGERPYVVREYVDGPTLEQAAPAPAGELPRLAVAVATGLNALHQAGIAHLALKPANVLLGPGGALVADYGIAGAYGEVVRGAGTAADGTGTARAGGAGAPAYLSGGGGTPACLPGGGGAPAGLPGGVGTPANLPDAVGTPADLPDGGGTPAYLAPEQIAGLPGGAPADVFAWAAMIGFAPTGVPPFGDGPPAEIAERVLRGEPRLDGLPAPLREVVIACLAKDPAARPTMREVLLHLIGTAAPTPDDDFATPAATQEFRPPSLPLRAPHASPRDRHLPHPDPQLPRPATHASRPDPHLLHPAPQHPRQDPQPPLPDQRLPHSDPQLSRQDPAALLRGPQFPDLGPQAPLQDPQLPHPDPQSPRPGPHVPSPESGLPSPAARARETGTLLVRPFAASAQPGQGRATAPPPDWTAFHRFEQPRVEEGQRSAFVNVLVAGDAPATPTSRGRRVRMALITTVSGVLVPVLAAAIVWLTPTEPPRPGPPAAPPESSRAAEPSPARLQVTRLRPHGTGNDGCWTPGEVTVRALAARTGGPLTIRYAWLVDGTPAGATASTLIPGNGQRYLTSPRALTADPPPEGATRRVTLRITSPVVVQRSVTLTLCAAG
ncbi:protein kinase [Nonomuraea sp. AD125B]|uniref:serine/threonine-protein kinase n=1 Tax=Nonomuraea sp. AD125B TaxID=3242897 RepID=UPI0035286F68